eukprot:m.83935 g.83935  ORF g.83935 m.83935 type:complete len:577 (-) comp25688_c0_seq1:44-1774(-)
MMLPCGSLWIAMVFLILGFPQRTMTLEHNDAGDSSSSSPVPDCLGPKIEGKFLFGCTSDKCKFYTSFAEAYRACMGMHFLHCGGITQTAPPRKGYSDTPIVFQTRKGATLSRSNSGENSWVRKDDQSCHGIVKVSNTITIGAPQPEPVKVDLPAGGAEKETPSRSQATNHAQAEENNKAQQAAEDNPYKALSITNDASQSEIRKAYRALAIRHHPDRGGNATIFALINAAYDILGDPDKRAAFDDFGTDNEGGFDNYWQYQNSNRKSTKDFYVGDQLVHRLTDDNWDKRARSGTWLITFYAPWCSHCQKSTKAWKEAASEMDGVIEFGAVNGVIQRDLVGRFGVSAYPSIFLYNSEHQVRLQYSWKGPNNLANDLNIWSTRILADWNQLFRSTNVVHLDTDNFKDTVLSSSDMWFVMFTNGQRCNPKKNAECSEAKPNFYRLSADLNGIAGVGELDCSTQLTVCSAQDVPRDNYPYFYVFRRGKKKMTDSAGEMLFSSDEMSSHLAFPLVAKVLRMALEEDLIEDTAVGLPPSGIDYETYTPPPPPPPPPIRYEQPRQRSKYMQVGGSQKQRMRLA